jgi:hypothetical protein
MRAIAPSPSFILLALVVERAVHPSLILLLFYSTLLLSTSAVSGRPLSHLSTTRLFTVLAAR